MSFINLMANDVWSDADITNRTEAMVRAVISQQDELIINRKIEGARAGQYVPTEEDQVQMARLAEVSIAAHQAGIDARADMALLLQVFSYEAAKRRLSRYRLADGKPEVTRSVAGDDGVPVLEVVEPAIEPITEGSPDWPLAVQDDAERAEAQAVIDAAQVEVAALAKMRGAA